MPGSAQFGVELVARGGDWMDGYLGLMGLSISQVSDADDIDT